MGSAFTKEAGIFVGNVSSPRPLSLQPSLPASAKVDHFSRLPVDLFHKIYSMDPGRALMECSDLLSESKSPYDSVSVSTLRLLSTSLSVIGNSLRTCMHLTSGDWAGQKMYLKKVELCSASVKILNDSTATAVPSNLVDLHDMQPSLTFLLLHCDATLSPDLRVKVPLGYVLLLWEHTLKHLRIYNVDIGANDSTGWGIVFARLTSLLTLGLKGISPALGCSDLKPCLRLQKVRLNGANILEFNTLDLSCCTDLRQLICNNCALTTLDVSSSPLLATLNCSSNSLRDLDVSLCTALTQLDCSHNKLWELGLSSCPALAQLDCSDNWVTRLNLSTNHLLQVVDCSLNHIRELDLKACELVTKLTHLQNLRTMSLLDLSQCTRLQTLVTKFTRVPTVGLLMCTDLTILHLEGVDGCLDLNFADLPKLKILQLIRSKLIVLDVSACLSLTHLDCHTNLRMITLLATGCTSLQSLDLQVSQVRKLDVSGCSGIQSIKCLQNAFLDSLDLSTCSSLCQGVFEGNPLTTLDLSFSAATLVSLCCVGSARLTVLTVNGCSKLVELDCSGCASLKTVNCGGCTGLNLTALPFQGTGRFDNMTVEQVLALED